MKKLNELAIPTDGEFVTCYAELAKELDMAIGITFLERRKSRPRNTICLYDHYGKSVYKYSKVHICNFGEADDESVLCAGDEFIVAELDTAKGKLKVGSMICYDREFPESARILMLKGAELVLVQPAITQPHTWIVMVILRCLTVWYICRNYQDQEIPAY